MTEASKLDKYEGSDIQMTTPTAFGVLCDRLGAEKPRESRAGEMRERLTFTVRSNDPRTRYVVRDGSWNLAFQLQEHFAYWNGLNPGHVDRYVDMSQWLDDEGELPGSAYGDRMRNTAGHDQLERVERQLRQNPDTRRAVVQVHQAAVEDYAGPDVSCTSHLHFFRRDGELHLKASLRSQDVFHGYCYDAANNQYMQEALAGRLGLDVGHYHHVMDSAHLYERHVQDMEWGSPVAEALSQFEAHSLPDMRLEAENHDAVMELLGSGLERARAGEAPWTVINMLHDVHEVYADWLRVMASYEQSRFHGDYEKARRLANDIGVGWWEDWALKELEDHE